MKRSTRLKVFIWVKIFLLMGAMLSIYSLATSCRSKDKATERYRTESQYETESSSIEVQNDSSVKDSVVQNSIIELKEFNNRNLNARPVDPTKPSQVSTTKNKEGEWMLQFINAQVDLTETLENTSTTDSTKTKVSDTQNSSKNKEESGTSSGQSLDKGRTSDVSITAPPTWIAWVLIGGILIFAGYKYFGGK